MCGVTMSVYHDVPTAVCRRNKRPIFLSLRMPDISHERRIRWAVFVTKTHVLIFCPNEHHNSILTKSDARKGIALVSLLFPPSFTGYHQSEPANVGDVGLGRG